MMFSGSIDSAHRSEPMTGCRYRRTIIIRSAHLYHPCARAVGALFRFIGQPQVCGEIAAGLALGPSVFGALFPRLQQAVFDPATAIYISVLSQIGLVFTMFLVGLESISDVYLESHRTAVAISAAGLIVPIRAGTHVISVDLF